MIDLRETPYCKAIDDSLLLRTAVDEADVERVAQFNGSIHGPGVVGMTRNIFLRHPCTTGRDLIFVEDTASGQVVSSLCLIPWTWQYANVTLSSGEMGIVGTQPEYRRRGLIRAQVEFFNRRLAERGCHLSQIQGIAYYYRQFGYDYALPLEGGLRLTARDLPEAYDAGFRFRIASQSDLPLLQQMYCEASGDTGIRTLRTDGIWHFLTLYGEGTEMECEVWLIEDALGKVVGYARLPHHHFGKELTVNEVSRLSFDACLALLHHLVALADSRYAPGVRLCLPATSTLVRVARSLGAFDMGNYAWQIRITDVVRLLQAIAPALEARVAGSPFDGLTRELHVGFFRKTVAMQFTKGKLLSVHDLGAVDDASVRFPPQAFLPLVLGYRRLDEIRGIFPDVGIAPECRLLVETLFPPMTAFLYTIY